MDNGALWWKNAILYELYVDKFGGNFRELTRRLDYLNFLGVDCVHVLPFYPSPMIDDGYDVSDYKNVADHLGTLREFEDFVRTAHASGIRVMIDLILNHASTMHPWFLEAKQSRSNPKRDYFLWSETGKDLAGAYNAFSHLKMENWIRNPETNDYYFTTFYPEQADLNWDNPKVLEEMTGIMDFWAGLGVDGFRLDAARHLVKREGTACINLPETHAALKKIRAHVDAHYPHTALLAEVHGAPDIIKKYFGDGDECHMAYHFPLTERILLALKRNDAAIVRKTIDESWNIPGNCQWAVFLRNHDEISLGSLTESEVNELMPYLDIEGKYVFNGKKGVALRFATIFRGDRKKIIEAFRLLFSVPGSPVIYYGEEIGMENEAVQEGIRDTRKYVRGKFNWQVAQRDREDADSVVRQVARMAYARRSAVCTAYPCISESKAASWRTVTERLRHALSGGAG